MANGKFFLILVLVFGLSPQADALLISPIDLSKVPAEQTSGLSRYEQGLQALFRSDLSQAEQAFRDSMQLDPQSPQPLIGMADIALQRKQSKAAWEWLDKALKLAPQNAQVHHAVARYYYHARQYDKAEGALKKAIFLEPRNLRAQLDLGDLYINILQRPAQAISAYRAALAIDTQHAGAHHGLGMALAVSGKTAEAEGELRKAANLAPDNPLPLQALGRLYLAEGKQDKALAAFDAALKAQPDFAPARLDRGDIYLGRNNHAAALTEYQRAAQAAPKYDLAQLKLGMAYQALHRPAEAKHAYHAALRINPRLSLAYNNLAWMHAESRKDPGQALEWARKAVELSPQVASFHDTLGWVYHAQGRFPEAEKALIKAADMKPESAETFYHLGMVYLDQTKTQKAKAAFHKSMIIQKDYAPAREALVKLTGP